MAGVPVEAVGIGAEVFAGEMDRLAVSVSEVGRLRQGAAT